MLHYHKSLAKKSKHGFVLFSVLIMMQMMIILFSMMVLSNGGLLKQTAQYYRMEWIFFAARKWMLSLATDLPSQYDQCLIRLPVNQRLQNQSRQWWQEHACHHREPGQNYYYVIESLGQDVCGLVSVDDNTRVADYYRLTVNLFDWSGEQSLMLLQHVYAVAAHRMKDCESQAHSVKSGLQSGLILSMD